MAAAAGTAPPTAGVPLASSDALEVRVHPRKGRSLHTTRLVRGGEVVLAEAPLLVLAAPDMARVTCATCLRAVGPQEGLSCTACGQASFCSDTCQAAGAATPWLHSPPMCSAYARVATVAPDPEVAAQLHFLLHALALRHSGTPEGGRRFAALWDLGGEPTAADLEAAARLAPLLAAALGGPPQQCDETLLAALLRKEQLNSYGVLAAPQQLATAVAVTAAAPAGGASRSGGATGAEVEEEEGDGGERRLRGSALYAQASLINHECIPNVARFDAFDAPAAPAAAASTASTSAVGGPPLGNTAVAFRALHDLPAGTELAQSYVPLHWDLDERQAQCREVYGFACTCPRCQTESQWSDYDEEGGSSEWETDSGDDGGGEGMEADGGGEQQEQQQQEAAGSGGGEVDMVEPRAPIVAPPGEEGPLEPAYLRLFLLKYMCAKPGCFGTAAPPTPGSDRLQCAVCGAARSEADFLRELQRAHRAGQGGGGQGRGRAGRS